MLLSSTIVALGLWSTPAAQAQICTREYAPVCGQIAGQAPQTFPNRCVLDNAQARLIDQSECPQTALPQTQPLPQPGPQPLPMPGSDNDAHGCKGSAGFVWNAEMASCIRPWMSSAITLEVAAHRQKCTGLIVMQCLMVRELQDGEKKPRWTPLYGEIQGYQHQTGKRQLLRVRKDRQENVPADAPSITYTLIKKLR
jgi:Domain of unknown function (DUF4377)/Kazal-type serine protease inhibitor domain